MRKVKNDFKIQRKKTVYRHCGGHISHHFRNRIIYKDDNRPAAKHGTTICGCYDNVSGSISRGCRDNCNKAS